VKEIVRFWNRGEREQARELSQTLDEISRQLFGLLDELSAVDGATERRAA